jgi:ParB-like chromosome segregation protein Spo0J
VKIETVPISKLKPSAYNPRKDLQPGNPAYESLKKSIETFGDVDPIVWNKRSGHVVSGHQRLKVLKARGDKTIKVSVVDLDPAGEKALNLALNKIDGEWDDLKLRELLEDLKDDGIDLLAAGFGEDELAELLGGHGAKIETVGVMKAPPKLAWYLIGIPLDRLIEHQQQLEKIQGEDGVISSSTIR